MCGYQCKISGMTLYSYLILAVQHLYNTPCTQESEASKTVDLDYANLMSDSVFVIQNWRWLEPEDEDKQADSDSLYFEHNSPEDDTAGETIPEDIIKHFRCCQTHCSI